jgi:hypothetical protein
MSDLIIQRYEAKFSPLREQLATFDVADGRKVKVYLGLGDASLFFEFENGHRYSVTLGQVFGQVLEHENLRVKNEGDK